MQKALFPGSFDPPTYGHLNIIERVSKLCNELIVVIAINNAKKYFFSEKERFDLMKELTCNIKNVSVHMHAGLIVDYAHTLGADVLIRGVRNVSDFSYEFDLSLLNKSLNNDIETLFLATSPEFFILKSSAIKELASFGGNVSKMVPAIVATALAEKYKNIDLPQDCKLKNSKN